MGMLKAQIIIVKLLGANTFWNEKNGSESVRQCLLHGHYLLSMLI